MIKDRPAQNSNQSIADFCAEHLNHLKLKSCLEDSSINLNNAGEKQSFFGSLRRGKELLNLTDSVPTHPRVRHDLLRDLKPTGRRQTDRLL